ncbi:MAG: chromate reductase [Polaribacter sp.]|jgi:chromate reductase
MKKILAFAGSNHAMSINHQLVKFTASLINNSEVKVLDIKSWDIPMYSINMDPDQTPEKITELISLIKEHDGFIISSPEHNGGTPAFFKNIIDWLSRRGKKVFDEKPVLLMSTSPGPGAGATNLKYLLHSLPYQGATIGTTYSLPSFFDNFKDGKVIGDHLGEIQESIGEFKEVLNK